MARKIRLYTRRHLRRRQAELNARTAAQRPRKKAKKKAPVVNLKDVYR